MDEQGPEDGDAWGDNPLARLPNRRLVASALTEALADRLELQPESLGDGDPEVIAAALNRLLEQSPPQAEDAGLPDSGADPQGAGRRDLLTRALRDHLAVHLATDPARMAGLTGLAAAAILTRLGTPPAAAAENLAAAPLHDRRDVVTRTVRDGLAGQLAVHPQHLRGMPAGLAALALIQMLQLRNRVAELTRGEPAPAPRSDRREVLGRTVRDLLAVEMGLHPRLLCGLSPVAGATLLGRLGAARRELEEAKLRLVLDDLTGAYSRTGGGPVLEREIRRSRRLGEGVLAIAFIDMDSLKSVNDEGGHQDGDRLLAALGHEIRSRLRTYDTLIRWGGDEFVLVFPQTGEADARRVIADIQQAFGRTGGGHTFSAGFATLTDTDSAAELVARADQELYRVKRGARSAAAAAEPEADGSGGVEPGAAPPSESSLQRTGIWSRLRGRGEPQP